MSQPYSPYRSDTQQRRRQSWFSGMKLRLIIGAGIAIFTLINYVNRIGEELVFALNDYLAQRGIEQPYRFEFHLLDNSGQNRDSVNAFALPGGQVFITEALYRRLPTDRDGPLAGVLGHEIGHVLERHSAERMTSGSLMQGLARAAKNLNPMAGESG